MNTELQIYLNLYSPSSTELDRGSIPGRDRPDHKKQVVTAQLPNARQHV